MKHIFSLSGDYPNLAKGEITALFGIKTSFLADTLILCDGASNESILKKAKRLGLTKKIFEIKHTITPATKEALLEAKPQLENTYRVDIVAPQTKNISTAELADTLYDIQTNPQVSLHQPQHHYYFIWLENSIYFTEIIYENKDEPDNRRSHLKEHNHPTSTHPKIAKAMINLSGADSFIDPFCGAGGILIEGSLMGLNVRGRDIDKIMIKRAQVNAKALGLHIDVRQGDALELEEKTPAIVTDLPFGRNSTLTQELETLYKQFFTHASTLTSKLIVGLPNTVVLDELLEQTPWKQKETYSIYVHKSLTRKIILLEQ